MRRAYGTLFYHAAVVNGLKSVAIKLNRGYASALRQTYTGRQKDANVSPVHYRKEIIKISNSL